MPLLFSIYVIEVLFCFYFRSSFCTLLFFLCVIFEINAKTLKVGILFQSM